MPSYTKLIGVTDVDKKHFNEQLIENLTNFFNWGLLEASGYTDVHLDPTDVTNDDTLLPVHMPGQQDGCVWQAVNRNWVWESGLESQRQPIAISGVYVNGSFNPIPPLGPFFNSQYFSPSYFGGVDQDEVSSSGTLGFFIDYPEGRVIFDNPLPSSSVIQAEYSYRWVNFYDQKVPWFRDVIFDSFRYSIGPESQPSGMIGLLKQNSVQLPAIVIETAGNRRFLPMQQGNLAQYVFQDFLFHILAEDVEDRDFLIDAVTLQKDSTIYLFDANARLAANQESLDYRGSLIPGALMYPDLVQPAPIGFQWNKCFFYKTSLQDTSVTLPLFKAIVRVTLEVAFLNQ